MAIGPTRLMKVELRHYNNPFSQFKDQNVNHVQVHRLLLMKMLFYYYYIVIAGDSGGTSTIPTHINYKNRELYSYFISTL